MRRALAVTVAVAAFFTASVTPGVAEPASSSSASAIGLGATGLVSISPTITAEASQPPDTDLVRPQTLLTVPLGGLALAAAVGADAHAHRADDIPVSLGSVVASPSGDPTIVNDVNAQGLAKTAGAALVFNDPGGDPNTLAIRTLLSQISSALGGLLTADAVVAEAVAKCVNNQPVFDTGFEVVGLGGLVGGILDPVTDALVNTLLGLLGPGTPLSAVISIDAGVTTPLADGVAIDGLVVRVPLLNETIVISHAEAHMPPGCSVAPPKPPQPTGPGEIAPRGEVAPRAALATTGGDFPYLPVAAVMMGAAYGLYRVTRRRPERSPVQ